MRIFSRTPTLRWTVPVVTAAVLLGGGWTVGQLTASAQDGLKPRTAAQLLVDVQRARLDGLSGTIVQRADLGIPNLPGGSGSSDLTSLVSGTHTLRVWLSGPDKARLALLGTFGESDVILNGRDLWTWSSRGRTATHRTLRMPTRDHAGELPRTGELPITPQQAASKALAAIDPTTRVDTNGTAEVAGRRAYELVLQPRAAASLVGQVRIAIDGRTHVPLRVQVVPRGSTTPAFEVGFTHFDPTRPDAAQFSFNPPPGTTVTEQGSATTPGPRPGRRSPSRSLSNSPRKAPSGPLGEHGPAHGPRIVGHGWTTVLVAEAPVGSLAGTMTGGAAPRELSRVMEALPRVSGAWGSGRLLRGKLFSVLVTDDGRVAVGAVAPQALYDALAAR